MKVKVIKATFNSYWYTGEIGKTYDVEEVKLENHKFKYKVVGSEPVGTKYFYEDDVEIINEERTMKKSDLRTGMRVVHGKHSRNGEEVCIIVKDLNKIMFADGSWNYLSSYADDLTMSGGIWDITEVYGCPDNKVLDFTSNPMPLLWKRNQQTPEQKQLQEVMTKISELQAQAEKLQGLICK